MFFFKQKTAYEMRISDWSSDVCSSDLVVEVIGPDRFRRIPCPTYAEIELAILPYRSLVKQIEAFGPDAIHIATEGPLGLAARKYCTRNSLPFTTAYHTKFPEYIAERTRMPRSEEHTSALQSLMRISYSVLCMKKQTK